MDVRIDEVDGAQRSDGLVERLVQVWERSVRATHLFLTEDAIADIRCFVPEALRGVEHLAVAVPVARPGGGGAGDPEPSAACSPGPSAACSPGPGVACSPEPSTACDSEPSAACDPEPVAFMGIEGRKLEMLFVDSAARGQGVGRALLTWGIERHDVDELGVNEQNPQARGFYEHLGFKVYRRTETDEQGNPYPILYMRRCGA